MRKLFVFIFILFINGLTLSQTPDWRSEWSNGGNGNFSGWVPSSADVYRPIAFIGSDNNDLLFINISTGWVGTYSYRLNSSFQLGWWPQFSNNGNQYLNNTSSGWHIGSTDAYVVIKNPSARSYVLSLVRSGGWAMINKPEWNGMEAIFIFRILGIIVGMGGFQDGILIQTINMYREIFIVVRL